MSENSIKFSLSNSEQRDSWLNSGHRTLDADNQTVKNNYLLPLITDLIDNVDSKKVFTKMDLRWGFNNVRIKEGDEWKGAFITHISSFKPTVMFFRITRQLYSRQ